MTFKVLALVAVNDSLNRFGYTMVYHEETNYTLAMINREGKILYTASPLGLRRDECVFDEDFGSFSTFWEGIER